jgi:phage baseplate assembly protein W
MADFSVLFGGDLSVGPTGDIALADGPALTQQRVLRRLLTNAGDYIWQLDYGAGLGRFVGQPGANAAIQAVVRTQMLQEAAVAASPAPVISAAASHDGTVNLTVQYSDTTTRQTSAISFSV